MPKSYIQYVTIIPNHEIDLAIYEAFKSHLEEYQTVAQESSCDILIYLSFNAISIKNYSSTWGSIPWMKSNYQSISNLFDEKPHPISEYYFVATVHKNGAIYIWKTGSTYDDLHNKCANLVDFFIINEDYLNYIPQPVPAWHGISTAAPSKATSTSAKKILEKNLKINFAPITLYAEESQSKNIKFSFFINNHKSIDELFSPVLCRDFLSDSIFAQAYSKSVSIYGFTFNAKEQKLDTDSTNILMYFDNITNKENFMANIKILSTLYKDNKFKGAYNIGEYKDNPLVLPMYFGSFWQSSVVLISTLTFILRAMTYKYKNKDNWLEELKDMKTKDGYYCKDIFNDYSKYKNKLKLFRGSPDNISGWEKESTQTVSTIHNLSGIVSIFGKKLNAQAMQKNKFYSLVKEL